MHDSFGVWVMVSSDNGNLRKITLPVLLLASAFAISACQSKTANLDSLDGPTTASTSPASFKKTTELGNRWQGDPKNLALGLAYAAELEKLGQTDQQLQVLFSLHLVAAARQWLRLGGFDGPGAIAGLVANDQTVWFENRLHGGIVDRHNQRPLIGLNPKDHGGDQ